MDAPSGGTGRHGSVSRMRAGVARAVQAGVNARGFTPAALVSFLTAAAFTPLLVPLVGGAGGGEAAAALAQLGGIGGGYLAGVLSGIADRARHPAGAGAAAATDDRIRAELAEAIRRVIDSPGEAGAGLRGEISAVLREVDAVGAAMAADRGNVLAPALAELGEHYTEFRWVLGDLGTRLAEVQRTLVRQGCRSAARSSPPGASWIPSRGYCSASSPPRKPGHRSPGRRHLRRGSPRQSLLARRRCLARCVPTPDYGRSEAGTPDVSSAATN
jgi:hypothetical protein